MENEINWKQVKIIASIFGVIILLIVLSALNPLVVIGAGSRGVVFNRFSGIENRVLGEGTHVRIPLVESVTSISVKVQKSEFKEDTASKDLQRITMNVAVNWSLVPSKVNHMYQTVGDSDTIVSTILSPRVQQSVKNQVSQYSAEEVQKFRDKLVEEISANLTERLKGYDIILTNVSIINLDYTAEFNTAIEQKQLAQQDAEKASYLKQKAENEAKAVVAKAQGEADAQRITADAQAYTQKQLQISLTPELLQKMMIEKWKGEYPTTMLGGSIPLLQLPGK